MWSRWQHLQRASDFAEVPHESGPIASAAIQMLYAADLQWDRFRAAADPQTWDSYPVRSPWLVEAHLFLVAADNARDRLAVWARMVEDDGAHALAARLDDPMVKIFRHHQEHLEERMPGGKHEDQARLSAPGNRMIRIEEGSVVSLNNLEGGRVLAFGDGRIDLATAHGTTSGGRQQLARVVRGAFSSPAGVPVAFSGAQSSSPGASRD